jgi:hypothetical protein
MLFEEIRKKLLSGEKAISSSALKASLTSTRELYHYYLKDKTTKAAFDFGNAFELYLIDKVNFYEKVAVMDETQRPEPSKNYQTKVNAEWKAKFYADNADKYIIPSDGKDSFETIVELEKIAKKHPMYEMLVKGDYQRSFEWICPITGLKRYTRPDVVLKDEGIIIDIKTDAQDDFQRSAANNHYFLQALDHMDGALHTGCMEVVKEYYWAVFEKTEPYHVTFYQLDVENILPAEALAETALRRIKEDLEKGTDIVWRDMPIRKLNIPAWYAKGAIIH